MPRFNLRSTEFVPERAIIVGVDLGKSGWPLEESLDELERLAQTDGAEVITRVTQKLDAPISRTFIGSGKALELKRLVAALDIDIVIFDDELSPSQQSNLERLIGEPTKVIDRTALILDIFGYHAKTREGRLQVQLAQLQYLYPRLRGMWSHLAGNSTRGGIGSRFGMGESQLEVDRRLIRARISTLRRELKYLDQRRGIQSKARWDSGVWSVALVGYTNAGKSTILNRLTGSEVYAKDELFATLDPTTRSLSLEEGRKITLTDTVGFIQKLPTTLVEAFKSTLAEVVSADLILLVVDAADPNAKRQIIAVRQVLEQIEASQIPTVLVYNKCDLLGDDAIHAIETTEAGSVAISAQKGWGLRGLLYRIAQEAAAGESTLTACVPYDRGALLARIHERCQMISERYEQSGVLVTVKADKQMAAALKPYQIEDKNTNKDLL
ncbi:GTPase HflX [Atopobium sp. oral taxon 810]|uniref:GTPase HflX n=1 Tax=Atopobium sp. oral taxon 810 TaxID=712158 RepID=UPI0003983CBD|nr:GTPase HflX [Atopobium sp. oral taxon 810]ERI03875.1 GTP-binding protein HflX [Atopobium sp. oral taxon 810 str. F0209]